MTVPNPLANGPGNSIDATQLDANFNYLEGLAARNILINGAPRFWQRGTSFSSPANGSYTADRWQVQKDISVFTFGQESTIIDGFAGLYSMKMVVTTLGGGSTCKLVQQVENYQDYRGKTITFTARVRCNTNTCISLNVFDGTAHFSDYAVGDSTWRTLSVTLTVSNTATSLQFQIGCVQSDATPVTAYFQNMMAVMGAQSVPFYPRPYAQEFAMCQRYYQVYGGTVTGTAVFLGPGQCETTTLVTDTQLYFPVPMRAAPTATISNTSHFQVNEANGTAQSLTSLAISTRTFGWTYSATANAATLVAGNMSNLYCNSASGQIAFDAEM